MLKSVLQDILYATRRLRREPSFTVISLLTLAFGIALNTAVFSLLNTALLRPLPFPGPEQLLIIRELDEKGQVHPIEPDHFFLIGELTDLFAGTAGMVSGSDVGFVLTGGDEPERLPGAMVTENFFQVLGVEPLLGRTFTEEEDPDESSAAVVISHRLWRQRFNSAPEVLGTSLRLNRSLYTVVGVMPQDFALPIGVEIWVADPFRAKEILDLDLEVSYAISSISRLKPGVTLSQAQSVLTSQALGSSPSSRSLVGIPLQQELTGDIKPALFALSCVVLLVLAITCVNLAHLQSVRGAARYREIAIRYCLGARRARIIRLLLVESLLLALLGGLIGLGGSVLIQEVLALFAPVEFARIHQTAFDANVLAFNFVLSLATGAAAGLIPAFQASAATPFGILRGEDYGPSGLAGHAWSRVAGVTLELALTLALLTGTGVMASTLSKWTRSDLGFSPAGVLVFPVQLPAERYSSPELRLSLFHDLLTRLERLPQVAEAGAVDALPLSGGGFQTLFLLRDRPEPGPGEEPQAHCLSVAGSYFSAAGISLVAGRLFSGLEATGSNKVAVVDVSFARRFWPDGNALGKWISIQGSWREVIGVVGTVQNQRPGERAEPQVYLPYSQAPFSWPKLYVVIRPGQQSGGVVPAVRSVVWQLDKDLPMRDLKSFDSLVSDSVAVERFVLLILATLAAASLVASTMGVYGVVSASVQQRKREIGIRMALGAGVRDVVKLLLKAGLTYTILGLGIGVALSLALGWLLSTMLFGISVISPLALSGAVLMLGAASLSATLVPALRVAFQNPQRTIRSH